MNRPLFSPSWYRVAKLTPRLRSQAEIHRTVFRGQVWYVVEDHATGAFQRLSEAAYRLVGLMNGKRTVEEIWRIAGEALGDHLPTQDETIELLSRLHQADILHAAVPPDLARVVTRGERTERKKRAGSLKNPLAIRVPLFDPDLFLRATMWLVRPLFSWLGAVLWLGVVATGLTLAATNWDAIASNVSDRALTAGNILLLIAIYPAIKALHEFGHAYAVRRWGGEVHEIGIMFLVFMPVPYVDASASSAFRSKWQRAAVAAAGIAVEVFLAALAITLWTMLEPGLLRAAMLNVALLAGISTILFNGNPLLRFDGYYILADLLEIPNLGTRSTAHLQYIVQRHLFGLGDAVSPALAPGERRWFVIYGIASLIYRYLVMTAIIMFVAGQFFEIGIVLAFWTLVLLLVVPAAKGARFILTSPKLEGRRPRALLVSGAVAALVGWVLFVQPVPSATVVQGVVWSPETSRATAGADGFVTELLADPETVVEPGTPILRIEDPLLDARVALLTARVNELKLRRLQTFATDPVATDLAASELELAEEELALSIERRGETVLTAGNSGRLLLPFGDDLVGRHVRRGDVLAWVVGPDDPIVRTVIPEREIDLLRRRIEGIALRRASLAGETMTARLLRQTPSAVAQLPSAALGTAGGGRIALDPAAADGVTPLGTVFVVDLAPSDPWRLTGLGERVHVRFDHGRLPLGRQLWRSIRQVFLRDLNV